MKHIYIIIGVALLLFASCGRQQTAKSIVKDFMEAHVEDYSKVSYLEFCDIDSTRMDVHQLISVKTSATSSVAERPYGSYVHAI